MKNVLDDKAVIPGAGAFELAAYCKLQVKNPLEHLHLLIRVYYDYRMSLSVPLYLQIASLAGTYGGMPELFVDIENIEYIYYIYTRIYIHIHIHIHIYIYIHV